MRSELFIGGDWRNGKGASLASRDPATHADVWRGWCATDEDVADAFAAAHAAFPGWARTPLAERIAVAERFATIIRTRKEELARLISQEMGKPLWEARTEADSVAAKVAVSIAALQERAGEKSAAAPFGATALMHRAHGVFAVLGPFNFPAHLPNGHIVPALLAGNTLVFKPSEQTPGVGLFLAQAWADAGLPAGALNVVVGARDVGQALLDGPVAGVLFTGSAATGAYIHRHFAGRPEIILALEMGGNAPLIVWPPADADVAANLIVHSAFLTTGQRCSCARRLILPTGAAGDAVLDALVALIRTVKIGPWTDEVEPFMGPLATLQAARNAEAHEQKLIKAGARWVTKLERKDAFVNPAVIAIIDAEPPDEEVFAPILHVYRAASFEAALARANATRYGLAGGLISEDAGAFEEAKALMNVGVLNWNRPTTGASSALPFGGLGASGNHRPSAFYAADYCAYPVAMQIAETPQKLPAIGLGA